MLGKKYYEYQEYPAFGVMTENGVLTGYGFFFVLYSSFLLIMMWSDMVFLQLLTAIASGLIFLLLPLLTRGGIGWGDIKILAALGLWPGDIFSLN